MEPSVHHKLLGYHSQMHCEILLANYGCLSIVVVDYVLDPPLSNYI